MTLDEFPGRQLPTPALTPAPTGAVADTVREYYGRTLASSADLKTSACCTDTAPPAHIAAALERVHDEVMERFYGCGSPVPPALEGATVLDLGCGSGRDVYVLSQLTGPTGTVTGVDMTGEQLAVARRHQQWHAERFGHANTDFRHAFIENLAAAGIEDGSVDVVVSNCVLNLSPDKPRVFSEIFRVLKPGGELYFSDIFADRRLPPPLLDDPVLVGECLAGALYTEDFRRVLDRAGCADARTVTASPVDLGDPEIERKIGFAAFTSRTVRAFKLPLEDRCEDYGQIAVYRGTIAEHPHAFDLDDHHRFPTGKPVPVCGNTADMLGATRYAAHFTVTGDKSRHFGLFPCAPAEAAPRAGAEPGCC
ncbi:MULTISPECIES: methyltransferase domain-containing protein [Streptomyces]|uniref:Arsenite methyltransferase n=1 Tax=Streptomyces xinghaiensis TaxID=1038928 RepID=A0A3S5IL66_9ACTN|nr:MULTISPECIES: methyltransferase domain-containing protein [Streptomyces]PQM22149.1 methyltransferase domain-containing protein [Streptomyces xinghaiensis]RKM95400.1 methyltransferase domain-containing protein [Streptomyces xinghaiensis]RNC72984.1 methyltransferase domain-containing protein [Streptomyces xinghaiensis]